MGRGRGNVFKFWDGGQSAEGMGQETGVGGQGGISDGCEVGERIEGVSEGV